MPDTGRLTMDPELRLRKFNRRDSGSAEGTRAENQVEEKTRRLRVEYWRGGVQGGICINVRGMRNVGSGCLLPFKAVHFRPRNVGPRDPVTAPVFQSLSCEHWLSTRTCFRLHGYEVKTPGSPRRVDAVPITSLFPKDLLIYKLFWNRFCALRVDEIHLLS
jgi:hypothetical protein